MGVQTKKGDSGDIEYGMVVGARGLVWLFQKLLIYWDSIQWVLVSAEKWLFDVRDQIRRDRLLWAGKKAIITTHYNKDMHKSISDACKTLKQMSNTRCHKANWGYKAKLSQTAFLNTTVSSLFSNSLHRASLVVVECIMDVQLKIFSNCLML